MKSSIFVWNMFIWELRVNKHFFHVTHVWIEYAFSFYKFIKILVNLCTESILNHLLNVNASYWYKNRNMKTTSNKFHPCTSHRSQKKIRKSMFCGNATIWQHRDKHKFSVLLLHFVLSHIDITNYTKANMKYMAIDYAQ